MPGCGDADPAPTDPPAGHAADIPGPEPDPLAPGPWAYEAGFRTLHSVSRVVFDSQPKRALEYEVTLAFPDRLRTRLLDPAGGQSFRRLHYLYGGYAWFVEVGESASRRLDDDAHDDLRRVHALRRALLLWPDDASWETSGRTGTRDLGELGTLTVALDDEGWPERMASVGTDGEESQALTSIEWGPPPADGERRWPARFDLMAGETRVWQETTERVETTRQLIDDFFRPADVRDLPEGGLSSQHLTTGDAYVITIGFDGPRDWDAAWSRARAGIERLGAAGEPVRATVEFELDASERPVAVILLRDPKDARAPSPAWSSRPGAPAFGADVEDPSRLPRGLVRDLARRIRLEGGTAGPARVRWTSPDGPGQLLVPRTD